MRERQIALHSDHQTRDQFLVFTDVPECEASRLSDGDYEERKLPHVHYDEVSRVLVIKIMAEGSHFRASGYIHKCIC